MKNFFNIEIDGHKYLEGFLGLDWRPSDEAKLNASRYEEVIEYILKCLWGKFTSYQVLLAIHRKAPKKVTIRPIGVPELTPADKKLMQNYPTLHGSEKEKARGLILDQFHGTMAIPKDSTQVQAKGSKVGVGDSQGHITHHVMTKDGKGSDVTINFNPGVCGDAAGLGLSSAGWSSDEVLFHELVHAMSCIEGTDTTFVPFLSPLGDLMYDSFDNLEEFTAIVIANVYRSECGRRGLRASHKGKHMMELEASGQEFYNFYQQDMKQMCMFYRMTARELKRAVNIPFNPFVYCEV